MAGILEAILLGILQGITEWLPVSSKGNVAMLATFFGFSPKSAFAFAVLLHFGTLIAATIYFRKQLFEILQKKNRQLLGFTIIALACTAITALPAYFLLKATLETEQFFLLGFVIGTGTVFSAMLGFFLIVTGLLQLKKKKQKNSELTNKTAVAFGLAQGFTALPGLSRSGTTTSVLLFEGYAPKKAFELSFFISIPTVLLAEISFGLLEQPAIEPNLFVGIIAAAITGYFSIGALLKNAKRINFGKFCLALGIFYLAAAIASIAFPALV